MDRIFSLHAKIFRRFDQADAIEVLPQSVDLHPGDQRIFRSYQPLCETQSICRGA
jgi:hypothetical protein